MQKETPKAGKDFLTRWLRVIKCGLRIQQPWWSLYPAKALNITESPPLLISSTQALLGKIWREKHVLEELLRMEWKGSTINELGKN